MTVSSALPPPCTWVSPPCTATEPSVPSALWSGPGVTLPEIVRWSLPWPSMTLTTSTVDRLALVRMSPVTGSITIEPKLIPPGNVCGSPKAVDAKWRSAPMERPVSAVALRVPVWSCWLSSSKMLRTSTCWASGGCGRIPNGFAFFSPGSSTGARSERSALVVPPSTSSGPRMLLRMCGCFGKLRRFWRSGGRLKLESACTGTDTGIHQFVVSNVTCADCCVNV